MLDAKFIAKIAGDSGVNETQVQAVIGLLEGGATIPFIARYRKDVTDNLNEVQIENVQIGHHYFGALMQRRKSILENIDKQGKLTEQLRAEIDACMTKNAIEDLYLPFKRARRTKATIAKEQGLEPLAEYIHRQEPGEQPLAELAATFVNEQRGVGSADIALEGARNIIAERISLDASTRGIIRDRMLANGQIKSYATKNAEGQKTKYEAYYAFSESAKKIPSHRTLAILRGVREGFLRMELALDDEALIRDLQAKHVTGADETIAEQVRMAVEDAFKRLLRPSIENEVVDVVRQRADEDAIRVFRDNSRSLLLMAPAGRLVVLGLDPGLKSGCKAAVVDDTGTYVESATFFPEKGAEAEGALSDLIVRCHVRAVAIGNGTGSRETWAFVSRVLAKGTLEGAFAVMVNEAGASVYSASKVAREEFPELDVIVRGAISIARRLQDPLAELVKIEPRSIGVGQYQHDVNQKLLREGLHNTVVSCVNQVGVDLNTASVALLRYVSGIQYGTAQNIVAFRTEHSGFKSLGQLLEVPGIGPKVFEQCAGFLRIRDAENILDSTTIHPEAYTIVEQFAASLNVSVKDLVANSQLLQGAKLEGLGNETVGKLTLEDIRAELAKPARDPRSEFRAPKFRDDVNSVADLAEGMVLEGVVTNVTNFGAFIDIGVHQEGLVHLSELAYKFVEDPRQIVHVGEIVNVKVISVDKDAPRVSLSLKAMLPPPVRRNKRGPRPDGAKPEGARQRTGGTPQQAGPERQPEQAGSERPPREEGREGRPRGDGRERPPREGERERKPREEGRDRKPREEGRDRGPRRDKRDNRGKGNGTRPRRDDKQRAPKPMVIEQPSTPLNTQLAYQLELLKQKFGG
ncbi:MAG: Tex-like N-terminal domain-containing protein, partial [Candidatus Hydrogenedentota bacterium]